MTLENLGTLIQDLSSLVGTLAIIIGGILAWRRWGREAPESKRADLSHEIDHCLLSDSLRLVHTTFTIRNTGTVTLELHSGYTFLQRVTPLVGDFGKALLRGEGEIGESKTEYAWPLIGEFWNYPTRRDKVKIDSGETDHLYCDFIIPAEVKTIFVYSNACLDPKDPKLGWDVTSFHDLEGDSWEKSRSGLASPSGK